MYILVTRYGIYIKPRVVLIILRRGLGFSKASLLLPSALGRPLLLYVPVYGDKPRRALSKATPSNLWDQPVLMRLCSVWSANKLVWSLRCPLPLGVGPAWCRLDRRRIRKAHLWHHYNSRSYYYEWLNWRQWGRVGFGAENEYMNNVGSNRANTGKQVLTLFLFVFLISRDET